MNTSFSKRRHIQESNLMVEQRFLTEKVMQTLTELANTKKYEKDLENDPDWGDKFTCIKGLSKQVGKDGKPYKPTVYRYKDDGSLIYVNGRLWDNVTNSKKMYYWYCKSTDESIHITSFSDLDDRIKSLEQGLAIYPKSSTDNQPPQGNPDAAPQGQTKITAANDPTFPKEEGMFLTDKDPYQYKVVECMWYVRRGPKEKLLKNWVSLEAKPDAITELDKRFPEARKNCATARQVDQPQSIQSVKPGEVSSTNKQPIPNPQYSQKTIQQAGKTAQRNPALRPK